MLPKKFMSGISSLQSNLSQLALTLKLQSEMPVGLNTLSVRTALKKSGVHTNRENRIKVARRSNCADKSSQRVKIVRLCPLAIL